MPSNSTQYFSCRKTREMTVEPAATEADAVRVEALKEKAELFERERSIMRSIMTQELEQIHNKFRDPFELRKQLSEKYAGK